MERRAFQKSLAMIFGKEEVCGVSHWNIVCGEGAAELGEGREEWYYRGGCLRSH